MNKILHWFQRVSLVLMVALLIIALDQWSKNWVRATIPDFTYIVPVERLGDYLVFEHVHNYGAAFGILQNFATILVGQVGLYLQDLILGSLVLGGHLRKHCPL